jgi:hypothetical protein
VAGDALSLTVPGDRPLFEVFDRQWHRQLVQLRLLGRGLRNRDVAVLVLRLIGGTGQRNRDPTRKQREENASNAASHQHGGAPESEEGGQVREAS